MNRLPINLIHYSAEPIQKLDKINYYDQLAKNPNRSPISPKPVGIWVSIEDYNDDVNWKSWCEDEEFRLEGLKNKHHITLKEDANILLIDNYSKLIVFTMKYRDDSFDNSYSRATFHDDMDPYSIAIKWHEVSIKYDGIFIAPYIWAARLELLTSWYYGWDCSSGCIWNVDCIEKFQLLT